MAVRGIANQVAVIGSSCTAFGDLWDTGIEDLAVDAALQACESAGVELVDVDAFWFGSTNSAQSGLDLSRALKLDNKPVTRVANFCVTGSDVFRNAAYAVAAGAYDTVMAIGVEKLKDSGYAGLVDNEPPNDGTLSSLTPPARFSLLVPAYCERYGVSVDTMRETLTHIAQKNHANGALNSRAQFRRPVSSEQVNCAPVVAGQLGVLDCSGMSDGAAAAVLVHAESDLARNREALYVKGMSFTAGPGTGPRDPGYDYVSLPEVAASACEAYRQAGIRDPRSELLLAEVHDCFTPTELILMEDLGLSRRGEAWRDVLAGVFDLAGELPVNPDGGLKSFGHPVGASGLRMLFECWLQLRGEAPVERQITITQRGAALVHNLGGAPGELMSFVSVLGTSK
ncbi:acetyl-CoA acetyltransferase [Pseudonocardia hispaniensis]|uniref:Acetyl-CoA acetyltransferase n=1 Tax=Pseudonocardia hispaniensis TaxID=904933 RepID=A0ABW1J0T7_9PSEU